TLGKPDTGLIDLGNHLRAIAQILRRRHREADIGIQRLHLRDLATQCAAIAKRRDARELRCDRRKAFALDGGRIHARSVKRSDLLRIAAGLTGAALSGLQDTSHDRTRAVFEQLGVTVLAVRSRYWVRPAPRSGCIREEILAGVG